MVTRTLETTPKNATHWSTRSMATASGLSQSTVSRIWRAFGLKPHRSETFKLSTDPLFIDKVRDVVGLYLDPPEQALVLCVDEKSQIQALDRTQPVLPMMPGRARAAAPTTTSAAGTTTLFAALDVATGKVIGSLHRRHRAAEFMKFLTKLDKEVPAEPRPPPDLRQLRHPQDPADQEVAAGPPPLPPALHPDQLVLAQPGRALVRRADATSRSPRRPQAVQALEKDIRDLDHRLERATPSPSSGPRPPTRSSNALAAYCRRITDSGH